MIHSAAKGAIALVVLLQLTEPSRASQELATLHGDPGTEFGAAIAVLGDWNGDGHDEYVVGVPGSNPGTFRIVNGADHATIWSPRIIFGTNTVGAKVADAGDFNADGYRDLLVGFVDEEGAYVFSGEWIMKTVAGATPDSDIILLWAEGGGALLGGLNMNDDGQDDVLIGNPTYDWGLGDVGMLRAFTGGSPGQFLDYFLGENAGDRFGASLAKLRPENNFDPDVDLQEYLVGAPGADKVYVLEGGTLDVLSVIQGPAGSEFGATLAVLGDTTGDGMDEFIVGAPKAGPDDSGQVFFYSSETGGCTQISGSLAGQEFGISLAATGDINLDDIPDFVVSGGDGSGIFIYSGSDCSLAGPDPIAGFPLAPALAGGGDVNNDGLNDIFIGSPSTDTAAVYSTADLVVPAFVDSAWLLGGAGAPRAYVTVRYPTYGLQGQSVMIDVEYDVGAGFFPGSSNVVPVPPDAPPQLEHVTFLGPTVAFVLGGTYRYRTRSYLQGEAPGPWSAVVEGHPSADRALPLNWYVDIVDQGMFFVSMNSVCGDPYYFALNDYDQDCDVDIVDFGYWMNWRTVINM